MSNPLILILILTAEIAVAPTGAGAESPVAQKQPLPLRQARAPIATPADRWQAVATGPHVFYGTIARIASTFVTIRLRSGNLLEVNAAQAISHGDFSAPLFIGKVVSVDGVVGNGTFIAAHIFRLDNLRQLPDDH